MSSSLPAKPGLARRLAYGEVVRQLHRTTGLSIRGTALNINRNRNQNTFFARYAVGHAEATVPHQFYQSSYEPRYEDLIELEDIKIGLKISDLNNNSHVYTKAFKIITNISLCIICQEFFNHTCIIRELNCGHPYHLNCIDRWFEEHTFCPICKHNFN